MCTMATSRLQLGAVVWLTRMSSQYEEVKNRERGDLDDFPISILDNWICRQRGTALSLGGGASWRPEAHAALGWTNEKHHTFLFLTLR